MGVIGISQKRKEDPSLLTGRAKFVADMCDESTEVQFIRSPIAKGKIKINRKQSVKLITGHELADINDISCKLDKFNFIPINQPFFHLKI